MKRTGLLSLIILVVLLFPVLYVISMKNAPSAPVHYGLLYIATLVSGPLLLVYGYVNYKRGEPQLFSWIAFVVGGLCTGFVYGWGTWKLFTE